MTDEEQREKRTDMDPRIATAYEQLKKAAYFAELACESLSPVEGEFACQRWERIRDLMFSLREERDTLWCLVDGE